MPRTRYATSQGLNIAYQVLSDGPTDVVNVHGLVSHQDLEHEVPLFRSMNQRLAELGRAITFDKRGTGCSDRDLGYGAVEDRMDDIRAVMDAVGLERAHVIGSSEGGALALGHGARDANHGRAAGRPGDARDACPLRAGLGLAPNGEAYRRNQLRDRHSLGVTHHLGQDTRAAP